MSDERDPDRTRRRLLVLAGSGSVALLAGCSGGDGGATPTETRTATTTATATASDGVPEQYRTATSQGGTARNPGSLQTKNAVNYQTSPKNDQQCAGCTFYIPDKNGDGMGACAIVEGKIAPDGWCVSYAPYEG